MYKDHFTFPRTIMPPILEWKKTFVIQHQQSYAVQERSSEAFLIALNSQGNMDKENSVNRVESWPGQPGYPKAV